MASSADVVAKKQMRSLGTEVDLGSMRTMFEHGLFDPKGSGKSLYVGSVFILEGSAAIPPRSGAVSRAANWEFGGERRGDHRGPARLRARARSTR